MNNKIIYANYMPVIEPDRVRTIIIKSRLVILLLCTLVPLITLTVLILIGYINNIYVYCIVFICSILPTYIQMDVSNIVVTEEYTFGANTFILDNTKGIGL